MAGASLAQISALLGRGAKAAVGLGFAVAAADACLYTGEWSTLNGSNQSSYALGAHFSARRSAEWVGGGDAPATAATAHGRAPSRGRCDGLSRSFLSLRHHLSLKLSHSYQKSPSLCLRRLPRGVSPGGGPPPSASRRRVRRRLPPTTPPLSSSPQSTAVSVPSSLTASTESRRRRSPKAPTSSSPGSSGPS